jgi:hypothetical protein
MLEKIKVSELIGQMVSKARDSQQDFPQNLTVNPSWRFFAFGLFFLYSVYFCHFLGIYHLVAIF